MCEDLSDVLGGRLIQSSGGRVLGRVRCFCRSDATPGQLASQCAHNEVTDAQRINLQRGQHGARGDFAMNWQVAEAALFHGGGSSGYCEDEMEKEMAAYAEYLRRRKTEAKVEGEHADDSAAMAAEHRSMRERERQAGLARVEAERKENQESTSLVGQQFGLPPELSEATHPCPQPKPKATQPCPQPMTTASHQHLCGGPPQEILNRVGSVLGGDLGAARRNSAGSLGQGGGDPRSTRTFHYSGTQQGLTEAEHAIRERQRQGTLAFERRVDAVVSKVASGKRQDERWDQLERVDVGQAKDMLDRRNTLFHATENKQFVQMWRS